MKKHVALVAIGAFLLGASLCTGLVCGFTAGNWWGGWELSYLMEMPQGGVHLSSRTNAYWIKPDNNTMRFVRVPDPKRAQLTQLFPRKDESKEETSNENSGRSAGGTAPRHGSKR